MAVGRDKFLTSGEVNIFEAKDKFSFATPCHLIWARGPHEIGRLLDAILLNTSFDLVFVFELLQISSLNLLLSKSLEVLSASADSQSFNIVLAF